MEDRKQFESFMITELGYSEEHLESTRTHYGYSDTSINRHWKTFQFGASYGAWLS